VQLLQNKPPHLWQWCFLVNKENWTEQPWQWDASTTQVAPRIDGFGGNPIFSSMAASANKPSPPCNQNLAA